MASSDTSTAKASSSSAPIGVGQAIFEEIAKYAPASVAPYIIKAGPYVDAVGNFLNTIYPYLLLAWAKLHQVYKIIEPYHPEEFLPMIFGLVLAFFGGHFIVTIAAVEAFKMCGWDTTKKSLVALYEDYLIVKAASEKDDLVDDNNDGIADVKQIDSKELATRKIRLILKSCNPEKVSDALVGINSGIIAVIATLKVQFAQTITLGATIGGIIARFADLYGRPVLERIVPIEYHKWISPLIRYTCKGFGISIAWTAQAVASSIHSSLRGGEQFVKGFVLYCVRNKHLGAVVHAEGHPVLTGAMYAVALFGFYWQLSSFFSLSFPFNILLLPLTTLEWFLRYLISS